MTYKISQEDQWSATGTPWKIQSLEEMNVSEIEDLIKSALKVMPHDDANQLLADLYYGGVL